MNVNRGQLGTPALRHPHGSIARVIDAGWVTDVFRRTGQRRWFVREVSGPAELPAPHLLRRIPLRDEVTGDALVRILPRDQNGITPADIGRDDLSGYGCWIPEGGDGLWLVGATVTVRISEDAVDWVAPIVGIMPKSALATLSNDYEMQLEMAIYDRVLGDVSAVAIGQIQSGIMPALVAQVLGELVHGLGGPPYELAEDYYSLPRDPSPATDRLTLTTTTLVTAHSWASTTSHTAGRNDLLGIVAGAVWGGVPPEVTSGTLWGIYLGP